MKSTHLRNYKVSNEKIRIQLTILHFVQSHRVKQGPLVFFRILSVFCRNLFPPKSTQCTTRDQIGGVEVASCFCLVSPAG